MESESRRARLLMGNEFDCVIKRSRRRLSNIHAVRAAIKAWHLAASLITQYQHINSFAHSFSDAHRAGFHQNSPTADESRVISAPIAAGARV